MTTAAQLALHALDVGPLWLRLVAGVIAGAATWIVAADYGCAILSRLGAFQNAATRIAVGAAFGYALLGSAVGLLGLAKAIHPMTLQLLLIVPIVIRAPQHLQRLHSLHRFVVRTRDWLARSDVVTLLAFVVIALATGTALINAALPAVWWDPVAYHLPLAAAAVWHSSF
ncbi:MAG TPA: hypothetical protein VGQ96_06225, partial [Candidatus Eremiobacteraceae bacterium]|nr:hypothetical protein [Candidatus Eremiobacteraceae bacterium]